MLLKTNGDVAGVRPRVDFERVRDAILIEHVVEPGGVDPQPVLVADVDGDGSMPPQLQNVLVQERAGVLTAASASSFGGGVGASRSAATSDCVVATTVSAASAPARYAAAMDDGEIGLA